MRESKLPGEPLRYASRGGLKLEGALEDFGVSPRDQVCLDVGSSTGGFTDCLLQNGASKVYAVDVTIDQLDWKLRKDPRVTTVEAERALSSAGGYRRASGSRDGGCIVHFGEQDSCRRLCRVASRDADFLILIKPQFELDKRDVGKGGIVRDAALHQKAIERVHEQLPRNRVSKSSACSPADLTGTEGNQEFFLHAQPPRVE